MDEQNASLASLSPSGFIRPLKIDFFRMKKYIFLITITVFISFITKAQENRNDFREMLQFGIKLGTNYSNIYDAKGEDLKTKSRFGLAAGTYISIPIGKFIGIQPELLFSQKGFHATGKILGTTYEFDRITSYIDLPILIQLKPKRSNN
jgi:hypothetical protein